MGQHLSYFREKFPLSSVTKGDIESIFINKAKLGAFRQTSSIKFISQPAFLALVSYLGPAEGQKGTFQLFPLLFEKVIPWQL